MELHPREVMNRPTDFLGELSKKTVISFKEGRLD